ncbi:uncharacterized protein BKA55DRAFT_308783 [Fusarium redolens]|uniref:Uncharacterized protein n=1 Tax=Fusarium redolens TaxID=48865 RepID=A0A9P9FX44_FUSRE|nr:uncharacterized protein BKA55DRAFT_308783 [Fusarium redolens]KAH7202493.1 hypothetical protein BKA55DRAFT_308783 [Fusarium redolens]
MTSPCANYYGSAKCCNNVLMFGAWCDFCLTADAVNPMNNLLPHPSTPSREYVKPMNENVQKNKTAASKEDTAPWKRAYVAPRSV